MDTQERTVNILWRVPTAPKTLGNATATLLVLVKDGPIKIEPTIGVIYLIRTLVRLTTTRKYVMEPFGACMEGAQ